MNKYILILGLFCISLINSKDKIVDSSDCLNEKCINFTDSIKLDVVYIPQNDHKSCATTSVAMVISYYEKLDRPLDKETVWQISGTDENVVYQYGNDMDGLKRIADHYGYESEYIENMQIEDID